MYENEKVYVVAPDIFSSYNDGLTLVEDFNYVRYNCCGQFIDRNIVEGNPIFLQIIPYILVKKGDQFLAYKRLQKSGEPRLRNQYSLGIGGHINANDECENTIFKGLFRELEEEIDCNLYNIWAKGLIRDITSDTNDHAGLLFVAEVESAKIVETEKYEEAWMSAEMLKEHFLEFEGWARYIIDEIDKF